MAELQKDERIHIRLNDFIKGAERAAIPVSSLEGLLYTCLHREIKAHCFLEKEKKKSFED